MDEDKQQETYPDEESPIGCGLATMGAGIAILAIVWASYAPGYRPIGTGASFLFGSILILAGLFRVIMGVVARFRSRD